MRRAWAGSAQAWELSAAVAEVVERGNLLANLIPILCTFLTARQLGPLCLQETTVVLKGSCGL